MASPTDSPNVNVMVAEEVAELLRTSTDQVYRLVREGHLGPPAAFRVGRFIRFDRDAVVEWMHSGGAARPGGWRNEPQREVA